MTTNSPSFSVQANEVTYELHTLGWKSFQQLCVTIVADIWGQNIQSFYDSHDGGRDGAFYGTWTSPEGNVLKGSFTVQCKFTSSPDKQLKLADLTDELGKAQKLASKGLANNYFLFTNARVKGTTDDQLKQRFESIEGVNHYATYGVERICTLITESPRLRMLVPRVYGLGDLSQILDERAYAQATEILSALGDDLGKFVITDAYKYSARSLVDHGFVLLLGEPACGKSTIAAALAVGAIDEWGCSTIKVRDADDFVTHSNPHEPKQFFWVDDAFGATQLDWQQTIRWNQTFPHIQAAIRRGARFVFTSRDYIYRAARSILKQSSLPVMQEAQVVIHVEQLAEREKEQILYNHIRLGGQSQGFKQLVKPHLPLVAKHKGFSPEIARRLGTSAFTRQLRISRLELERFVEHPMDFLKEVIETLDANAKAAIGLIFMRGGDLPSPVTLSADEENAITLQGGNPGEVRNSLVNLNGSLVLQVMHEGCKSWRFKHPTVRDAFASVVAENPELLDIYLAGTPIIKLFGEISCGDLGIDGVRVVVPTNRYENVIEQIINFIESKSFAVTPLLRFLATRCDAAFLGAFIARRPGFVRGINAGSYLSEDPEVALILRLHHSGLLPESERLRHIEMIRELAIEVPDSTFFGMDVRALFRGWEFNDLLEAVRHELLPALPRHVQSWKESHDGEEAPEDYFAPLRETFSDYLAMFPGDDDATDLIEAGLGEISEAIDELNQDIPPIPDDGIHWDSGRGSISTGERSIFDDVDH